MLCRIQIGDNDEKRKKILSSLVILLMVVVVDFLNGFRKVATQIAGIYACDLLK